LLTTSLDNRLWNSNTYRLEKTLNYGMERIWALGYLKGSNKLVLGYDEGCVMIKVPPFFFISSLF
jgi:coatomer subunit beta'